MSKKIKVIKEFSLKPLKKIKQKDKEKKFVEINTIEYWKTAEIRIIGNGITEKELIEMIAKEQEPKPEIIKFIKDNFSKWKKEI